MNLSKKLLLLLGIPLLAFLIDSWQLLTLTHAEYVSARTLKNSTGIFMHSSELINELQKERGLSAIYASGGDNFAEVESQRKSSDLIIAAFVGVEEIDRKLTSVITTDIGRVRGMTLTRPSPDVIRREYSQLTARILDFQASLTRTDVSTEALRHLNSLLLVEAAKESLGQLRAAGSSILESDRPVEQGELFALTELRARVLSNLDSRVIYLEAESVAAINALRAGDDWKEMEIALAEIMSKAESGDYINEAAPFFARLTAMINQIGTLIKRELAVIAKEAEEAADKGVNDLLSSILLTAGALFITIFASIRLLNGILQPVGMVVRLAEDVCAGNLSNRLPVNSSDEIGRMADALNRMSDELEQKARLAEKIAGGDLTVNFNLASDKDTLGIALRSMVENLNDLINSIREGAALLENMSVQISDSSQALSQGASESAASLEEISSTMVEIDAQTSTTAQHTDEARKIADQTMSASKSGTENMADMTQAVSSIHDSGKQITRIVKIIEDIAFQTNLLSLNAAVEAARAGRHGKGFAVVAEEVRKLSGRSAAAAKEAAEMVSNSNSNIEKGAQVAGVTAKALGEIEIGSIKTAGLLSEIAAASKEQAAGVSQIAIGLSQIDQVTQQNSAYAEETAAAAEELTGQVKHLREMVSKFRVATSKQEEADPHISSGGLASDPIKWGKELMIGINKIDSQHRRLVILANDLHHALREGQASSALQPILEELADYTRTHFSYEEQLMQQSGYPDFTSHKAAHTKLIQKLEDIFQGFKANRSGIGIETFNFIKDWLTSHIMRTDKKYVSHLQSRGIV